MSQHDRDGENPYAPPHVVSQADARVPHDEYGSATWVRYLVVAALCMAAFVAYVQRNSIGVAEQAISEDLGLSKFAMGWVMSSFFLTYALLQLPTGWLGKTMGTRRAMPLFAGCFSATAALFACSFSLPILLGTRLMMGAAQSGIFPCAVNTISRWLPDSRRSMSAGFLASSMSVGGALGTLMIGALLPYVGWRIAYALFAIPGLIFAGLFYWWFRDRPQDHSWVNAAELESIGGAATPAEPAPTETDAGADDATPWLEILTNMPILALCAQQVFRAVAYIFFASWFATFLRETRGVGDLEVGILNSLPLLAVVLGCPIGGIVSDYILAATGSRRWSRQGVATICMLACGTLILLSWGVGNAWLAVLLISAGAFFAAFGGPCAYTSTIDMGGRHVTMVFSLMNMAGNIGAFVFPILVPFLLNEQQGVPGSGNWNLVLFVFAAMYFAAAFCWMFANPNGGLRRAVQRTVQQP